MDDEKFYSKIFFDRQIFDTNRFEWYRVKKSDGKDDPCIWMPIGDYYDDNFRHSLWEFQNWWQSTSKTAHFAAERYVMRKMLSLVMSFWNEKFSVELKHPVQGNEPADTERIAPPESIALPIHPRMDAFQKAARIGLYEFMFTNEDVDSYLKIRTERLPATFPALFAYRERKEYQTYEADWVNCQTGLFVQSKDAYLNFWYLRAVCAFFTLVFLKYQDEWDNKHLMKWGGRLGHCNYAAGVGAAGVGRPCAQIMGSNMNNPYLITL